MTPPVVRTEVESEARELLASDAIIEDLLEETEESAETPDGGRDAEIASLRKLAFDVPSALCPRWLCLRKRLKQPVA